LFSCERIAITFNVFVGCWKLVSRIERQFIEEGLTEDQVAIETLAAQVLPKIVKDPIPRTTLAQRLVAARRDTPGLIEPT
jgi:hypothetical protein